MKKISIILLFFVVSLFAGVSCDKRDNALGFEILPDYNRTSIYSEDFPVVYSTITANNSFTDTSEPLSNDRALSKIYVNSSNAYLGAIDNNTFGRVELDYLTQFYIPYNGIHFPERPINDKVDSVYISLYYDSFQGDSLAPIQFDIVKLNRKLEHSKYSSDKKISSYIGSNPEIIVSKSFIASKPSRRFTFGASAFDFKLDSDFGQEVYDLSRAKSEKVTSQKGFDNYFPGIYVKNSAGTGAVYRIIRTAMTFFYEGYDTIQRPNKPDSIFRATQTLELSHSIEVPQLTRFANYDLKTLVEDEDISYIKAPAGVFTQVTIPTRRVKKLLDSTKEGHIRKLNSIPFVLTGESDRKGIYGFDMPKTLLMLPKDSLSSFFEKEKVETMMPYTSYLAERSLTGTYSFLNIAPMILKHIESNPDKDLEMILVPVERSTTQSETTGKMVTTAISNLFMPKGLKINENNENNKSFRIYYTEQTRGIPFSSR